MENRKQRLPKRRTWYGATVRFYSICSRHYLAKNDCEACSIGSWRTDWGLALSGIVHKRAYWLWFWWNNQGWRLRRAFRNKADNSVARPFPNMKP